MYAHCIHIWSLRGQKRELDPLEVELQTYGSCHMSLDKQSVPPLTQKAIRHLQVKGNTLEESLNLLTLIETVEDSESSGSRNVCGFLARKGRRELWLFIS